MFEETSQIIKVDARNCFVDIREAFRMQFSQKKNAEAKVRFQFRTYNQALAAGSRITGAIDFYLSLEEFSYFSDFMKTGRIDRMIRAAKESTGNQYQPGYHLYRGSIGKDGSIISRQLKIEGGDGKYFMKALQGPGKREKTGAIRPLYTDKTAESMIVIALNEEQIRTIGLSGERAIRYYDTWMAMGTLKENVERLSYSAKQDAESQIPQQAFCQEPQSYPQDPPPAPTPQYQQPVQYQQPQGFYPQPAYPANFAAIPVEQRY